MNVGSTLSLGMAVLVLSRALPLGSLTAVFTGGPAAVPAGFDPIAFLSGIHLVFLISGGMLLAAVLPSALRPDNPREASGSQPDPPVPPEEPA